MRGEEPHGSFSLLPPGPHPQSPVTHHHHSCCIMTLTEKVPTVTDSQFQSVTAELQPSETYVSSVCRTGRIGSSVCRIGRIGGKQIIVAITLSPERDVTIAPRRSLKSPTLCDDSNTTYRYLVIIRRYMVRSVRGHDCSSRDVRPPISTGKWLYAFHRLE